MLKHAGLTISTNIKREVLQGRTLFLLLPKTMHPPDMWYYSTFGRIKVLVLVGPNKRVNTCNAKDTIFALSLPISTRHGPNNKQTTTQMTPWARPKQTKSNFLGGAGICQTIRGRVKLVLFIECKALRNATESLINRWKQKPDRIEAITTEI
jgi:hypothetical protein